MRLRVAGQRQSAKSAYRSLGAGRRARRHHRREQPRDYDRAAAPRISPEMKTPVPLVGLRAGQAVIAGFARFFDIVNGFFNRCRDASY